MRTPPLQGAPVSPPPGAASSPEALVPSAPPALPASPPPALTLPAAAVLPPGEAAAPEGTDPKAPVTALSPAPAACANCGAATGPSEYCGGCGQKRPTSSDYSMRELLWRGFEEVTSYDGRIWTTVRALLFRPGQVTKDHFAGRRGVYLDPFRIFVLANVAAWMLIPQLQIKGFELELAKEISLFAPFWNWALEARAQLSGISVAELAARIDAIRESENTVAVLCMSPLFALGVWLSLAGRGFRFVQHLVFAAHFYCIHLAALLVVWGFVIGPVYRFLKSHPALPLAPTLAAVMPNLWVQNLFVAPALFPYLYLAVRRAYGLGPLEGFARASLLTLWACAVARAFLDVAFALVLLWA